MGKLEGKVAVITASTSGMALATAKLFVEEGAYVFITGRRKDKLDEAVKTIGRNVTGVQGDASRLADLDRLYETVKREKGNIDILFASAGSGELAKLEEVTEEHFDKTFDLKERRIRVNILSPGTIDTPILEPLGEEAKEFFKSQIPRGEMGRPEEIATVALFLASSDSSFVNGVELFVDGGTAQI